MKFVVIMLEHIIFFEEMENDCDIINSEKYLENFYFVTKLL